MARQIIFYLGRVAIAILFIGAAIQGARIAVSDDYTAGILLLIFVASVAWACVAHVRGWDRFFNPFALLLCCMALSVVGAGMISGSFSPLEGTVVLVFLMAGATIATLEMRKTSAWFFSELFWLRFLLSVNCLWWATWAVLSFQDREPYSLATALYNFVLTSYLLSVLARRSFANLGKIDAIAVTAPVAKYLVRAGFIFTVLMAGITLGAPWRVTPGEYPSFLLTAAGALMSVFIIDAAMDSRRALQLASQGSAGS